MDKEFELKWEQFFRPETRRAGSLYFARGAIRISHPSDTEISASVSGSSPVKVTLKSKTVASHEVFASCTCPAGKKARACKHLWATLLQAEKSVPEFLDEKTSIELQSNSYSRSSHVDQENKFAKPAVTSCSTELKARQDGYRKQQYQRQKAWLKAKKNPQKAELESTASTFPEPVQAALHYFAENGFPMNEPLLDSQSLGLAKKKLSRVFHPDRGGTYAEIVKLNHNFDILLNYFTT